MNAVVDLTVPTSVPSRSVKFDARVLYCGDVFTRDDLEAALSVGHEVRGFEVKGHGPSSEKHLLAKVARAALSMGNLRDGGVVVVGIDDKAPALMLPGLSEPDLASWLDFDTISARFAEYADPPLRFDLRAETLSSGADVVIIEVHEFADVPHLCARSYEQVLRKGALYVRSRKLPETAEVPTSHEMREVLDLATEKRLRAFVESTERAGLRLTTHGATTEPQESSERYKAQIKATWDD